MSTYAINRPLPFAGTDAERAANWLTHNHGGDDGRCFGCDSKPWHAAADYRCGDEPPREIVYVTR